MKVHGIEDLARWSKLAGINPYGISAKTSRKSLESLACNCRNPNCNNLFKDKDMTALQV